MVQQAASEGASASQAQPGAEGAAPGVEPSGDGPGGAVDAEYEVIDGDGNQKK